LSVCRDIYNICMNEELDIAAQTYEFTSLFSEPTAGTDAPRYLTTLSNFFANVSKQSSAQLSQVEAVLYVASKRCFGSKLRSPTLGGRHIDKGVYIDQIIRWYASFRKEQFHFIPLERFSVDPRNQFQDLLDFLQVPSGEKKYTNRVVYVKEGSSQSSIPSEVTQEPRVYDAVIDKLDFRKRRLESPNIRMPPWANVSKSDKQFIYDFYRPYNALLLGLGVHF
jgi:hypothetical protein